MVTLDAWVAMFLLLGMALIAFSPRLAARARKHHALRWMGEKTTQRTDRWYWVLFALALVVGLGVRVWRFPELPRGLNQDGAMAAVESFSLLTNGTDQYGTPYPVHFEAWQTHQMSALLSYIMMPFLALLGISRLSIRLPVLIFGILTLPVFWDFARRLAGKKFALLALWLLAIMPWHIQQSRWALEATLMQHFLLLSFYFLLLGLRRKPFLYLSMACFGLTMYTYGITLYTVPVMLAISCIYLLWKRRIRLWEALFCAAIYLLVAAPFLLTMAINFFEFSSKRLGPLTLPRFYRSVRAGDILFFAENPFATLVENLRSFLNATWLQNMGDDVFAYRRTRTLYPFSWPLLFLGTFWLWWRRRQAVLSPRPHLAEQSDRSDAAFLVLAWLLGAVWCGLITADSNINRASAAYYPLILCLCVALVAIIRRVRGFAWPIALLYCLGFLVFCQGYFCDEAYIAKVGDQLFSDAYGALQATRGMDYDRFYVDINTMGGPKSAEMIAALAYEMDNRQLLGEEPLRDTADNALGDFSSRFVFTDFIGFVPDPRENAAYIIREEQKPLFDLSRYAATVYDGYTLLCPLSDTASPQR